MKLTDQERRVFRDLGFNRWHLAVMSDDDIAKVKRTLAYHGAIAADALREFYRAVGEAASKAIRKT